MNLEQREEQELREWGNGLVELIKAEMDEEGELLPIVDSITAYNEMLIIATPWRSSEEKHYMIEQLKKLFLVEEVVAYAQFSEAWKSFQKRGEPFVKPSEAENRKEVVTCNVISKNFYIRYEAEIKRDWKSGEYLELENEIWETINLKENPGYHGDMVELLPTDIEKFAFGVLNKEQKGELKELFYANLGKTFVIKRRKL